MTDSDCRRRVTELHPGEAKFVRCPHLESRTQEELCLSCHPASSRSAGVSTPFVPSHQKNTPLGSLLPQKPMIRQRISRISFSLLAGVISPSGCPWGMLWAGLCGGKVGNWGRGFREEQGSPATWSPGEQPRMVGRGAPVRLYTRTQQTRSCFSGTLTLPGGVP